MISGQTPEEPVVSKTGYIFEKRLIEKHIQNYGICPISGEILTINDLYPLKSEKIVKPRPISASSIPGLLSMFQTEWDAIIYEMFSLRRHVNDIRNQLSHSLYQYDAATRVIAKLLKEKNAHKEEIENLRSQIFQLKSCSDVNEFEVGVTEELIDKMQNVAKELLMKRKKRKIENVCSVEQWKEFKNTNEFNTHSSVIPGVTCLAIDINKYKYDYYDEHINQNFFSGGRDGNICYFSLKENKILSKLQGHLKKVNSVIAHPSEFICVSASNDKTVRIWKGDSETNEYVTSYVMKKHKDKVTSLSLHPLENCFISASKDNVWILHDIETSKTIKICKEHPAPLKTVSFHPDGMMLGVGANDGNIHIYDMKGQAYKADLNGHTKSVESLSFSENGYYLASVSKDNTLKLWDLRKVSSFQTVELPHTPKHVTFDYSGKYVSVSVGNDIHVYNFQTKNQATLIHTLSKHEDIVTQACFGTRTSYLLSASMDKTVKLWSAPE